MSRGDGPIQFSPPYSIFPRILSCNHVLPSRRRPNGTVVLCPATRCHDLTNCSVIFLEQRASSAAFVECKQGVRSLRCARKLRREPHRPFCPCTRLLRCFSLSLFLFRTHSLSLFFSLPRPSFLSFFLFHSPLASLSKQAYGWSPSSSHPLVTRLFPINGKRSPFGTFLRVTVRSWRSSVAFTVAAASSPYDPWRCNGDATVMGVAVREATPMHDGEARSIP